MPIGEHRLLVLIVLKKACPLQKHAELNAQQPGSAEQQRAHSGGVDTITCSHVYVFLPVRILHLLERHHGEFRLPGHDARFLIGWKAEKNRPPSPFRVRRTPINYLCQS